MLNIEHVYKVTIYASDKYRMIIPQTDYSSFQPARFLQHKTKRLPYDILSHQKQADQIYLSSALAYQLQVNEAGKIMILKEDEYASIYHPFAVMLHQHPNQSKWETLLQEMAETGEVLGFKVIFFTADQVDIQQDQLTGLIWKDQQWQSITLDIPPIIYNRLPNRTIESHPSIKQTKNYLTAHSIIFNPDFFNKWKIYDQLIQRQDLSYLLPECIFKPSFETLAQKLEQKPVYLYNQQNHQAVYIERHQGSFTATIGSSKQDRYQALEQLIAAYFPKGLSHTVLQEATTFHEPYTIRIHTIHTSEWELVLQYGKHHLDGNLQPVTETKIPSYQLKKMAKCALQVSEILIDEGISELMLEFVLDNEQRIWLLDLYAKPSWEIFMKNTFSPFASGYFQKLLQVQVID